MEKRLLYQYKKYHQKSHLYGKILPEIREEFDRHHDTHLEEMSYDGLKRILDQLERNMESRRNKLNWGALMSLDGSLIKLA